MKLNMKMTLCTILDFTERATGAPFIEVYNFIRPTAYDCLRDND